MADRVQAVTVHLDRAMGLEMTINVPKDWAVHYILPPQGATVMQLKEALCKEEPTGSVTPQDHLPREACDAHVWVHELALRSELSCKDLKLAVKGSVLDDAREVTSDLQEVEVLEQAGSPQNILCVCSSKGSRVLKGIAE
eukprot:5155964-Amphidinium_carterae.1